MAHNIDNTPDVTHKIYFIARVEHLDVIQRKGIEVVTPEKTMIGDALHRKNFLEFTEIEQRQTRQTEDFFSRLQWFFADPLLSKGRNFMAGLVRRGSPSGGIEKPFF